MDIVYTQKSIYSTYRTPMCDQMTRKRYQVSKFLAYYLLVNIGYEKGGTTNAKDKKRTCTMESPFTWSGDLSNLQEY